MIKQKIFCALLALNIPTAAFGADDPSMIVTGVGEVRIIPDSAHINLSVETKAKDARLARKKNAEEMNRVTALLEGNFKIEKKDMQSSHFNISPDHQYDPKTGKSTLTGFRVSHQLTVKIRNLEKAGEIIDKVTIAGSEEKMLNFNGITFGSEKQKEYELLALDDAMKSADTRAQRLAKSAKRNLGSVIKVIDQAATMGSVPSPRAEVFAIADQKMAGTGINPGEQTITARVTVEYQLK